MASFLESGAVVLAKCSRPTASCSTKTQKLKSHHPNGFRSRTQSEYPSSPLHQEGQSQEQRCAGRKVRRLMSKLELSSIFSSIPGEMAVETEDAVPGLINIPKGHLEDDGDSDNDEDERVKELARRLSVPQVPSIDHDFTLCDACYRISKEFGYLHIGGSKWQHLLTARLGDVSKPVSCCVLRAVIDHIRDKTGIIPGSTQGLAIPSANCENSSFGSKMSDILIFTDGPILREIDSALRFKWEWGQLSLDGLYESKAEILCAGQRVWRPSVLSKKVNVF